MRWQFFVRVLVPKVHRSSLNVNDNNRSFKNHFEILSESVAQLWKWPSEEEE